MESTQANQAVVIYHAKCVDGFASAWAFRKLKDRDYRGVVEYWAYSYGEHLGLIHYGAMADADVYIVDFSFSRHELTNIANVARSVTILDHHKTAQEALENWEDKPANVDINFDMQRSGAAITWDYFDKRSLDSEGWKKSRPELIQYVQDRDLWKFQKHKSKEINAVIGNTDQTFEAYDELDERIEHMFDMVEVVGKELLRQHQRICEDIVTTAREVRIQDGDGNWHTGLGCNCTHHFASEVGNLLATKSGTFGLTYTADGTGAVRHSIRSTGSYDVSKLAQIFGGGGHKNAAGFTLHPNETDRSDVIKIWSIKV